VQYHEKALISARTMKDPRSVCYALTGLGASHIVLGNVDQATIELKEAVNMDVPEITYQAQITLGIAYLQSNALALARKAFMTAQSLCLGLLRLEPRLFAPRYGSATALVGLAVSDSAWTDDDKRRRLLAPALRQYNRAKVNCPGHGILLSVRRDLELFRLARPTGLGPCFEILDED